VEEGLYSGEIGGGHYVTLIRWFSGRFAHKVILTGGVENVERASAMERWRGILPAR